MIFFILRRLVFLLSFSSSLCAAGQNVFDMNPQLKKDDSHLLSFTNEVITSREATLGNTAHYQVRFKVTSVADTGFGINWKYVKTALGKEYLSSLEDILISNVDGFDILISRNWRTIHLLDKEGIRDRMEKVLNEQARKSSGDKGRLTKMIEGKRLISSDQGLEAVLLKHVRAYFVLHGLRFEEKDVYVNQLQIPFALGSPLPAVETTRISVFDKVTSACEIVSNKEVESSELRKYLRSFMAKATSNNAETLAMIDKANLLFTEKTSYKVNYRTAEVLSGSYQRLIDLGFDYYRSTLSFEVLD